MAFARYHYIVLLLAAVLLAYLGATTQATATTHPIAAFVHIAATGAWFGISLWVTFVAGVLLFKYLPRHQFGEVQANIFPYYFGISFSLILASLAAWAHLEDNDSLTLTDRSVLVLGTAALLQALQLLALGPAVNDAMRARNRKEKEEGFADVGPRATVPGKERSPALQALSKHFAKLHGLSSAANLVVFLAALYQLYMLSAQHVSFGGKAGVGSGAVERGGGIKAKLKGW